MQRGGTWLPDESPSDAELEDAHDIHGELVDLLCKKQMLTFEENDEKNGKLPTKAMAANVPQHLWPDGVTYEMLPDIYPGWATALNKH